MYVFFIEEDKDKNPVDKRHWNLTRIVAPIIKRTESAIFFFLNKFYASCITCHMSCVMCHMLLSICHLLSDCQRDCILRVGNMITSIYIPIADLDWSN